ncbi:hypothetical protein TNCV_2914911 [Trichonephila clavipes]|nr:hypothetical protein TNCV_2914911 [Trichonephila clavipes]
MAWKAVAASINARPECFTRLDKGRPAFHLFSESRAQEQPACNHWGFSHQTDDQNKYAFSAFMVAYELPSLAIALCRATQLLSILVCSSC